VVTAERLEALRSQPLPAAERARLLMHLGGDCEECLAMLAGLDDDSYLALMAGPGARLSAAEAERMFGAAQQPARVPTPVPAVARPEAPTLGARLRGLWQALGTGPRFALGAVALASLLLLARPRPAGEELPAGYTGSKGDGQQLEVGLSAFAVRVEGGEQRVQRQLQIGEALRPGELLVFRYRLGAAAHLALVAEAAGKRTVLWEPDPGEEPSPRGERELQQAGRALALDPATLGSGPLTLTAIASSKPLAGLAGLPSLGEGQLTRACGGCAVAQSSLPLSGIR
jgi:hypothetical protein